MSIIIAGLVIQFLLVVYSNLLKRFPSDMLTDITRKLLGNIIGRTVNYVVYFYFILTGSTLTILMVKILNEQLLPLTPGWVLSLLVIASSVYLAVSNLRIISRFFVLASFWIVLLVGITLLAIWGTKELQFILPIGSVGGKDILLGSNNALLSMLGFEALLFLFPYVIGNKKGMLKTVSYANLFVTGFYTFVTFLCLITFSPQQLQQIREPVLFLFKGLTYRMVDRLDFIFLSIWIIPMTTSIIMYLFLASKSLGGGKNSYIKTVLVNGIIVFCISLIPHTDEITDTLTQFVSYLSYAIVIGLPSILLLLTFTYKKQGKGEGV
ncbi:spore germination protein [Ureibacillus chungkukjangi]|uniref:GerAB/ArcD/ProY family transporter n=1 Tax=Ureibacillus chungkukjangi TaxID=1202712 RepID=UPI00384AB1CC